MSSVGEKLRRARLDQGLQIHDLSTSTKISARFLEAIESDRRDQIPGGFFFKQWTIQYAQALSVDPAEVRDGIDRVLDAEPPLPLPGQVQAASKDLPLANRNSSGREGTPRMLLSFVLLVIVVLGCSGFYAWWHKQQQSGPVAQMTEGVSVAPNPVKPEELTASQISQTEKVTLPEAAAEGVPVSPVSQRVAGRIPPKKATASGQITKRQADLRKLSRRRLRARRLRRASSPELRAETRGD